VAGDQIDLNQEMKRGGLYARHVADGVGEAASFAGKPALDLLATGGVL
jgi:hypothetical protein